MKTRIRIQDITPIDPITLVFSDPENCGVVIIHGVFTIISIVTVVLFGALTGSGGLLLAGIAALAALIALSAPERNQFKYNTAIARSYRDSIRNALEAEHPECIAYILKNTLKQLKDAGIDSPGQKLNMHGDTQGYPDQSRIRTAILLANEAHAEWNEISRLGGIAGKVQALETIKNQFRSEDVWIAGMWPRVKNRIDLYSYSCPRQENATMPAVFEDHAPKTTVKYVDQERKQHSLINEEAIINPDSPQKPLIRDIGLNEFIDANPYIRYLDSREQEIHFRRYLERLDSDSGRSFHKGRSDQNSSASSKEQEDVW